MSVFALLKTKLDAHVGKRKPDELIQGVAYKAYKFAQRKSDYEDRPKSGVFPMNLIAYVRDPTSSNKYYVTMPTLYNDLSEEHVKELNDAIAQEKVPFIVFYGKDKNRNDCILHEYHESIDSAKLQTYLDQENASSPQRKKPRSSLEASSSFSSQE